jgi:hypothetical protein
MRMHREFIQTLLVRLLLGGWLALGDSPLAFADGGTLRQTVRQGNLVVSVFTSPTPPRVGPIDVGVLVQDAATGEPHPEAVVQVKAAPRDEPGRIISQKATQEAATNKLMSAANLEIPVPGTWKLQVSVDHQGGRADLEFELEIGKPIPKWFELAAWMIWPTLAIALYAAHRILIRRKQQRSRSEAATETI